MGNVVRGYHQYVDPEVHPKTHMPICFDPMYGFPQGRKKREMKVSEEEMDRWSIPIRQRDYCAHYLVAFYKCQQEHFPWASVYCPHERHAWELCQDEDQILRMKEYERERRLLVKERRLKEQQAQEAGSQ